MIKRQVIFTERRKNSETNLVLNSSHISTSNNLKEKVVSTQKFINVPLAWRRRTNRTSSLVESFYHAFQGLKTAFSDERNLKIHIFIAIAVSLMASYFKISVLNWALLIFAISLVITAELFNTAIERVVDISVGQEFNSLAKDAKDIAAGAVLCASFFALILGLIIFVPVLLMSLSSLVYPVK